MKHKAFKSDSEELWGVRQGNAILYDPIFTEPVARRIASLENRKTPPEDWHATEKILRKEGLLA